MTLRFCGRFRVCGIKSIALCEKNQPDVWEELCKSLSVGKCKVTIIVTLVLYQLLQRRAIKRFCGKCKKEWETELQVKVVSVLEKLFGCQVQGEINCYIGLYPTYIRNINKHFFLLPYGVSHDRLREIIIHELSHFYCYEACGNSLPSDKLWLLSEQIVPYILRYIIGSENKGVCYTEEESMRDGSLYRSWVGGIISFRELLIALKQNE